MADTLVETPKTETPPPRIVRKPKRHRGALIAMLVLLPLLVGGYFLWKYLGTYESTDDAQIDGHIHAISARISGHISQVLVEDQQIVKAGDVLVVIDPRDYDVAVAKAEADVADARAALTGSQTEIPITSTNTASTLQTAQSTLADSRAGLLSAQRQLSAAESRLAAAEAQVTEAQANYKKAADDERRYKQLVDKEEISQQLYEQAAQAAAAAKATVDTRIASVNEARHNVAVAEAAIQQAQAKVPQAEASIQSALTAPQQVAISRSKAKSSEAKLAQQAALLAQARLNQSYTTIVAPAAGIIGKKTVEVGQNVSPGQQLMAIVQLDDVWVIANFKETQLRRMQPGQRVRFSVDAYSREYQGRITGIGGASGSRFSLLPPENATGNYVKVVQRIPVRIDLDPGQNADHHLRPGMSVDPKVFLR
uniref:Secretion protein HlyD family protein n=1 Tax=Solibacter usitatus (strain Ellin6076) TaxID=234267 RepID=Q01SW2_SOLUE